MSIVKAEKLTKHYGKSRGILEIDFAIEQGEIFGFIGPNGAGKSTTIRTLLNFIAPSSGSATIFGKDIVKDSREIRMQVGYLPSEIYYYDDMKVIDLLNYSAGFHKVNNRKRIGYLAERLDLELNRKIEDLSFGNRKKTGIVQALLHEPKLLILDEPTGGLDPLMQNTFFELLREERDKGATILFSSHILNEVQKMCDRVAIIKEGRLMQVETVGNLLRNNIKRITLSLDEGQPVDLSWDNVIKQEKSGDSVTLLYKGDVRTLVGHLQSLPLKDIRIEEPTLEEIFMHYYVK